MLKNQQCVFTAYETLSLLPGNPKQKQGVNRGGRCQRPGPPSTTNELCLSAEKTPPRASRKSGPT